jgi:hypothetical protein
VIFKRRRGLLLFELSITIALVGMVLLMSAQALKMCSTILKSVPDRSSELTRADNMMALLRRDVWASKSITVAPGVLEMILTIELPDESKVVWTTSDLTGISRNEEGMTQAWKFSEPVRLIPDATGLDLLRGQQSIHFERALGRTP